MFPDGCTLPGSTQQRILVVLLKTSQTGVQHFWKRHVRLGGIGLPSILGFLGRMPTAYTLDVWSYPFRFQLFVLLG